MGLGAVIGGVASIGGAIISSNAAGNAADQAAATAAANNALQEKIYNQNTANEKPFMTRGNAAGDMLNAALGLTPSSSTVDWNAYANANPALMAAYNATGHSTGLFGIPSGATGGNLATFAQQYHAQHGGDLGAYTTTTNPATGATNALNAFKDSSGYSFALNQGLQAVNNNYATRGALNSGAAMIALNDRAQNIATQNAFLPWMSGLQTQQQVGLGAANALNGVGTNYANAVSSNNNNAAGAAGNAAIASGNAWSNGLNGVANALGAVAQGSGSSYFNPAANTAATNSALGGIPINSPSWIN